MIVLIGIAILIAGFIARLNPLLIVTAAALATSLAAGHSPVRAVSELGRAFNDNRYISAVFIVLVVIGLLERGGLQERARQIVGRIRAASAGRLLLVYFLLRQITAAFGLTSVGGQAQMVRPLIAPMAEAAAARRLGRLPEPVARLVRANAAAVDNVAVFFGEDIFIAVASILLIKGYLEGAGIVVQPLQLSVWAIPSAIAALAIHGTRLLLLDRKLARAAAVDAASEEPAP
jgi:uncharacterized membrane protein